LRSFDFSFFDVFSKEASLSFQYYKNSLTINRAEELGEVLLEELTKLFKD